MIHNYPTNNEEGNNSKISISSFDINNIHEATLCQIQVSSKNFNQFQLNDKYINKRTYLLHHHRFLPFMKMSTE